VIKKYFSDLSFDHHSLFLKVSASDLATSL